MDQFVYQFKMGDMGIWLCSDVALSFDESYQPFLCGKCVPDVVYRLCTEPHTVQGDVVYKGLNYTVYAHDDTEERVFVHVAAGLTLCKTGEAFTLYGSAETLQNLSNLLLRSFLAPEIPLLAQNALLLHASLIQWQGMGVAFSAPSGVGKSTQAELWHGHLNAQILNGDRALLRQGENGFTAYGSLFCGSSGICRNEKVPLRMIVILEQHTENELRPMGKAEAFKRLYSQCLCNPWNRAFVQKMIELLQNLLEEVPVYLLRCRPDAEATELVREALLSQK